MQTRVNSLVVNTNFDNIIIKKALPKAYLSIKCLSLTDLFVGVFLIPTETKKKYTTHGAIKPAVFLQYNIPEVNVKK